MNTNKNILVSIGVILVAFGAGAYLLSKTAPIDTNETTSPAITYTNASEDLIVVELPFPGAVVGKEFSVVGKARGNWYFEASFPVEVLDSRGAVIAQAPAQAQGEWMTTEYVPFYLKISFPQQTSDSSGSIVLKKDNPSGLPEHDEDLVIPIVFR